MCYATRDLGLVFALLGCTPTPSTTAPEEQAELVAAHSDRIDLALDIDPAEGTLQATATLTIAGGGSRAIDLFLNGAFTIEAARVDGEPATATWGDDSRKLPYVEAARLLSVAVPPSVTRPSTIELRYRGEVREPIADVNVIQADRVELAAYSAYYPRPVEQAPFSFRLDVTLPETFTVVTRGRMTDRKSAGDRVTQTWETAIPGTDVPLFAAADMRSVDEEVDGTTVAVYYRALSDAQAGDALREAIDSLRFFRETFGATEADALRIVFSPRGGWGYSRTGWFIVSEQRHLDLLAGRIPAEEARPRDAGAHGNAHEISHFWWAVADTTTPHDWINEALAEYSAAIDSRRRGGPSLERRWADTYLTAYERASPTKSILDTTAEDEHRYVAWYQRGALFFMCTERLVGNEALRDALRSLLDLGRRGRVVTDDVVAALRSAGVPDEWLDAWLRRPDLEPLRKCLASW